ncbi:hypothetical protein NT6N_01940 [Oceaniferula spumae]|uniref:DUF5666 domain-containing protein n=1 Tax=Oceaniferula spumae TaxID=2979115 RepID=A0AAT9FGQ1_9BACT
MKPTILLLTVLSAVSLVSCGEKKTTTTDAPAPTDGELSSLVLKSAPDGAIAISDVRKSAKEGDKVTITGKVIGSHEPFVKGRAIMTLGDPKKLTSCDLMGEDDHCTTPWDVCCDDPDVIKASIVTVQVVDKDGQLLKEGLKGVGGLKELSQLVVTGVVADGSTADNMLINATGIYVQN